jgi:mono/diheme cytochrome c family protein
LKGILAGILLALLATAITGYAIIRTGTIPANADERPPRLERWAARMSLHATLARSAPRVDAPLPTTDQNLVSGIKLYAQNCSVCHGDSSANATNIAEGLYQKPPQLGKDGVEDDPEGVTYWKIAHGIRWTGMPAFDRSLNETQIWQLTLFLKNMDRLPPAAHKAWRQVRARS